MKDREITIAVQHKIKVDAEDETKCSLKCMKMKNIFSKDALNEGICCSAFGKRLNSTHGMKRCTKCLNAKKVK